MAANSENVPADAAATANLNPTKPLASLIKLSPATKCMIDGGNLACFAIAATATGSVGDKMAAMAKATGNGSSGTNA